MALNDNVLDDLDDGGVVDNDLIVAPGQQTLPANNAIVNVNTNTHNQESSVLSKEDTEKLLNSNIQFKLVEDGHTKLIDLKDVENNIMGQESMDQKAAAYIDQTFGNYVTESFPIQMFSEKPTGVNFKHACKFMKSRIAQEEAQVISNYEILLNSFNDTIEIVEKSTAYLKLLKDLLEVIRCENTDLKQHLQDNKNLVYPYENEFINIVNAPLGSFDINKMNFPVQQSESTDTSFNVTEMSRYLNSLDQIMSQQWRLKSFILQNVDQPYANTSPISLIDLVKFYTEDRWFLFEPSEVLLNEKITRLKEIQSLGAGNIQVIEKQLTENGGEIANINDVILSHLKLLDGMIFVTTIVKSVFKELKKLCVQRDLWELKLPEISAYGLLINVTLIADFITDDKSRLVV